MKRSFKLQFFKFGVCIYLWGRKSLRQGEMSHGKKKSYTAVHRLYTNDGSDILNRIFGYLSAEMCNKNLWKWKNPCSICLFKNPFIHSTQISVTWTLCALSFSLHIPHRVTAYQLFLTCLNFWRCLIEFTRYKKRKFLWSLFGTSLWYKGTMNRNSTPKCDFIHEQGLSKITIPNRFVTEENKDFQWVYGAGTTHLARNSK